MKHTNHIPMEAQKTLRRLFPNSEAVFKKASEIMILKTDRCVCEVPVGSYYVRIPDTYQLKCTRCKIVVSPLSVTPLSRDHNDLTDTIDLVGRFYFRRKAYPTMEIADIYKCKYETARRKTRRVVDWMELALHHSDNPVPHKDKNDNKIIRAFSMKHKNLTSAVNALFHALPPLTMAFKISNK